jgi:hypothetical protein
VSSDQGRLAAATGENVGSILKHKTVGCGFRSAGHEAVLDGLMRELLTVMPAPSSDALSAASSRFLNQLPSTNERRPWVEAINPVGGWVTMREGKRANAFKGHSGCGFL